VPEPRDIPLVRWGEEIRRHRASRRSGRFRVAAAAAASVAATAAAATALWQPGPALVWNASASSPVGLYAVKSSVKVRSGDMVIAWPPGPARALAAARGYVPANVPLVKRVAATAGDRVCAAGEALFVNGRLTAHRRDRDAEGRPLPRWEGCVDMGPDDYFLLMPGSADSFDGRYFGMSHGEDLLGRALLIWAR